MTATAATGKLRIGHVAQTMIIIGIITRAKQPKAHPGCLLSIIQVLVSTGHHNPEVLIGYEKAGSHYQSFLFHNQLLNLINLA